MTTETRNSSHSPDVAAVVEAFKIAEQLQAIIDIGVSIPTPRDLVRAQFGEKATAIKDGLHGSGDTVVKAAGAVGTAAVITASLASTVHAASVRPEPLPTAVSYTIKDTRHATAASNTRVTFRRGETIYGLGVTETRAGHTNSPADFDTSFNQKNGLTPAADHHLVIGKSYLLPSVAQAAGAKIVQSSYSHGKKVTVQRGNPRDDTLSGIEYSNTVSQAEIILDNPQHPSLKTDPNYIQSGWVLTIPTRQPSAPKPIAKPAIEPKRDIVAIKPGMTEWDNYQALEQRITLIKDMREAGSVVEPVIHNNGLLTTTIQSAEDPYFKKQLAQRHAQQSVARRAIESRTAIPAQHMPRAKLPTLTYHTAAIPTKPTPINEALPAKKIAIIDSLNLSAAKKRFMANVIEGTNLVIADGAKVNAAVMVAEAADESAYGQSQLAKYNNFFGMKAGTDWRGSTVVMPTEEDVHGRYVRIMARFKTFPTAQAGLQAYANFIDSTPWYQDAVQHRNSSFLYLEGLEDQLRPDGTVAIAQGQPGAMAYATGSGYIPEIMTIIKDEKIAQLVAPTRIETPAATEAASFVAARHSINVASTSVNQQPIPLAESIRSALETERRSVELSKELARQILNTPNIDLTSFRISVYQDVVAAAAGQPGTAGAMTSPNILRLILAVGQEHKVLVTAIQSDGQGHCDNRSKAECPDEPHYTGDAVDFGSLDGATVDGRNAASQTIMNIAEQVLPAPAAFGQSECGSLNNPLPTGFAQFPDSCNHLHIQDVPAGS
jgi:flagellum-specific peptidoglycan hydrolase FlgJ